MTPTDRVAPALKDRLRRRELTLGSWLSLGSPETCEIMARAGFEWLVVDAEHTAIDLVAQLRLIQITQLYGLTPLVRVGANDPLVIKRAMDAGADGIVVPMVNTREDAMRAVEAAYYPPEGRRGVGLSRAQGYGTEFEAYRSRMAEETVVVVQIEHIDAVERLRDIVAVDGVDAFLVGPYDLSGSLGLPGAWDAPAVVEALQEIQSVVSEGNIAAGFHVVHTDPDHLRSRIAQGYRMLAYGGDMIFLAEKVRDEVRAARSVLPRGD